LSAAVKIHQKETADFKSSVVEFEEARDTLGQAITLLSEHLKQSSLLQLPSKQNDGLINALNAVVDSAALPLGDKNSLLSLFEKASQAPSVASYTPKSSGVVDVLKEMKEKARSDLTALELSW
jgi:hypothetical protein